MFAKTAKIKLRHLPTSGGGPSLTALLGGHVDILFSVPIIAQGQIKSGDVRPLAVTSGKRAAIFPNVPTLKELGYDVDYTVWCGVFAPTATPKGHITIIREAIRKVVATPEFQAAMEKMNATIEYMDAPEFQKFWEKDIQQMVETVRYIGKVE
jgi:tripartite-type tricarboxylate transporter receptor subunit TctC